MVLKVLKRYTFINNYFGKFLSLSLPLMIHQSYDCYSLCDECKKKLDKLSRISCELVEYKESIAHQISSENRN